MMEIQKFIRSEIAQMSRDQIIERIALLDTLLDMLLECHPDDLSAWGFTVLDIKSLKRKLISQLKQLDEK
jgi:hypothetical protein